MKTYLYKVRKEGKVGSNFVIKERGVGKDCEEWREGKRGGGGEGGGGG